MAYRGFIRQTMLAEAPPPVSERTVIGWIRINLLNGWLNATLTVLSVLAVAVMLHEFLPWAFRSSWTAKTLHGCREDILAAYGEGVAGACWAVIRDRYLQLIYGFYPNESYWRPNLTFILMLTALAPVLFPNLPRKLLLLSLAYPALAFWLLWGGSIWSPALVMLGLGVAFVTFVKVAGMQNAILGGVLATAILGIWLVFILDPAAALMAALIPIGLAPVESELFGGFMLSVIIGVTGITASLPLGILLALGRKSDMPFLKMLCVGFIEFIRGVPLITLLFVASVLLNLFLPPGTSFDIILRVVVMVTLFASAYLAEVVRGGLAGLPKGQYEAANALGFDYWKSMRLIILPQALKISIPAIVSTFIGLFKDTTLVSIIGLFDPIGLAKAIRADTDWNGIVWELYIFIAAIFFVFCYSMSRYSMYLEQKLETEHR